MRDSADQQRRTLALLAATPGWDAIAAAHQLERETVAAILEAAGALSESVMTPLNAEADRVGCRIEGGRVRVPQGFHAAFARYAGDGWIGLDLPEALGGSGLPLVVQAAVGQIFDRGCAALNMATGASRSGAVLLAEAAPALARDWVPELIAGRRATTICISEPGAGSDVGRIATRAVCERGTWRITGQKIWISFGDHDLVPLIGHCLLARSSQAPGTRGLSLFLVPSQRADGRDNGVSVTRIEDKMGLHGSPTCAMTFSASEGVLLGDEGRGLAQLFTMIALMRLQTGCQGLGAASRACDVAERYAGERMQGGAPDAPPVPIARHADVQRQLGVMRGRTEILRAAVLELACVMDLAKAGQGDSDHSDYAAFLLPLIKNFGAETGFSVSDKGIQVLGGAGYTAEFPLEQMLRDSRVLAIYEGTTGMQGLDFLERRLVRDRRGLDAFLRRAAGLRGPGGEIIARFAVLAEAVAACPDAQARAFAADGWLRAGWLAVTALMAPRVAISDADAAGWAMAQIGARFAVHEAVVRDALAGATDAGSSDR